MADTQKIIFQKEVFDSICSNLSVDDIIQLMAAYSNVIPESFDKMCQQIRFFDKVDQQFRYLPGIDPITIAAYRLIQESGLNNSLFAIVQKDRY